ncbi:MULTISPECIES: hypothetical protein [unclassified Streptomyces]|uniref:hypothetical protein n=1 Tax=unclassified Streptomyces TaxID=2593676 RepID=UPI0004C9719A|nr:MULTISPECIES: hypothetical protein [unclassified Streptomyces]
MPPQQYLPGTLGLEPAPALEAGARPLGKPDQARAVNLAAARQARLADTAREAGAADPEQLGEQLALLLDGAAARTRVLKPTPSPPPPPKHCSWTAALAKLGMDWARSAAVPQAAPDSP